MTSRFTLQSKLRAKLAIAFAVLPVTFASAAIPPEQADLAERLVQTAMSFAQQGETYSLAVPLSEAALRLVGDDARLLRQAIDLELKLGNRDKALELLGLLRKSDPGDELAQVQTIDLNVNRMQSADERQNYLKQVVGIEAVPGNVRSHAAVTLVGILKERSQDAEAAKMLEQAIKLNPSNPRALQLALENAFGAEGSAPKRAEAIVNLLMSNPMQPALVSTLAEELARAGMTDEALSMYRKVFDLETAMGIPAPANDAINASALLLVSASRGEAPAAAAAATKLEPSNARAWFMRLMIELNSTDAKVQEATLADAKAALTRNLMSLHRVIDQSAPEVKEDSTPAMPDIAADVAAAAKSGNQKLLQAYVQSLADIAWLDAFFAAKSPDVEVIKGLQALTGDNSPLIARLEGFVALGTGQDDQAKLKFGAIATSDPLARAGLLATRIKAGEDKNALKVEAAQLLSEVPVDVWSTTIRYLARDLGPLGFRTADADAVRTEALKLPDEWLQFPKNPNQYYSLALDPVDVAILPGEPMFVKVKIQNLSKYPLVIGPGGVVDNHVVIDASVKGPVTQYIPAVGVAKLTGRIVLAPRQTMSAVTRVDSGDLSGLLNQSPQIAMTVYTSAVSNARMGQNNAVLPGPGGQRGQADSPFERTAVAISKDSVRKELTDNLKSANPMTRLLSLRAMAANIAAIRAAKDVPEAGVQIAAQTEDAMRQYIDRETDPAVRAQALQLLMTIQKDSNQATAVLGSLLGSKDWQSRTMGVLVMTSIPKAARPQFLTPLASDPEEFVQRLSQAVLDLPDPAPATQPADTGATNP